MDDTAPNYHKEFLKSPHHAWLGILTLGAGFLAASPLALIAGGTAYALGWVYMPDLRFFRSWVDRRANEAKRQAALAEVAAFVRRRDAMLASLSANRRERYITLAGVCKDIEAASAETPSLNDPSESDPRLRKLDELMWTFLRLLTIEESLERFLVSVQNEDLPNVVNEAEAEAAQLKQEIDTLKSQGEKDLDSKERLLASRMERLDVLHKRLERSRQARENVDLAVAEQERLEQQIKLIRADAVATKNTATLSERIDSTVEHLDQTNKWLSEMDQFKDLVGDLPNSDLRVGFTPAFVPPPLQSEPLKRQTALRMKIKQ